MADTPTTQPPTRTPRGPQRPARTVRSRLAAGLLALGLIGGTMTVGAVVWHDIEQHSSTEASGVQTTP